MLVGLSAIILSCKRHGGGGLFKLSFASIVNNRAWSFGMNTMFSAVVIDIFVSHSYRIQEQPPVV